MLRAIEKINSSLENTTVRAQRGRGESTWQCCCFHFNFNLTCILPPQIAGQKVYKNMKIELTTLHVFNTICDTRRASPLLQYSKSGLVPETGTDDPEEVTSKEPAEGLVEFLWIFGRLVIWGRSGTRTGWQEQRNRDTEVRLFTNSVLHSCHVLSGQSFHVLAPVQTVLYKVSNRLTQVKVQIQLWKLTRVKVNWN